jgi:hypothetical protein
MGFKVGRTFVLEFEGTDLDGAVVKMRSCSVQTILDLRDAEDARGESDIFAQHLIDWNLEEEDGTPVEKSAAGFLSLEVPVRDLIFGEWQKATRGITAPLDHRSTNFDSSLMQESEIL